MISNGWHHRKAKWLVLYVSLLCTTVYPVLRFKYFPSQDGPAHLYNAVVVADYGHYPLYRDFFRIHVSPAGNLLSQLILTILLKVVLPHLAEQLLVTTYFILLPMSVFYLLRAVSQSTASFGVIGFVLASNLFIHLGFWNFCLSIPLTCIALGLYLRYRQLWGLRPFLIFVASTWIVYLSHIVSWLVLVICLVVFEAENRWANRLSSPPNPNRSILRTFLNRAMAYLLLGFPAILAATHLLQAAQTRSIQSPDPFNLSSRLWTLYSGFILHTGTQLDGVYGKFAVELLAFGVAYVSIRRLQKRPSLERRDCWLAISCIISLFAIIAPDAAAGGSYLRVRLAFYAWLFLIVWLSTHSWSRRSLVLWTILCSGLVGLGVCTRLPLYQYWSSYFEDIEAAGHHINEGATVLALSTHKPARLINPDAHSIDILTPKPFIDLRDYEAMLPYFSTSFRPERSPVNLGGNLDGNPPIFSIERYRAMTGRDVDFILISTEGGPEDAETIYSHELRSYQLVFHSIPNGRIRLYKKAGSHRRSGANQERSKHS